MNLIEAAIEDRKNSLRSIAKIMEMPAERILPEMRGRRDLCSFATSHTDPHEALANAMNFYLDEINRLRNPPEADDQWKSNLDR